MRRQLRGMEHALMLTDLFAPFNVVNILRFDGPMDERILRQALDHIQSRHPALQARVMQRGTRFYFDYGEVPNIPLRIVERTDPYQWISLTEMELNSRMDVQTGPLAHCICLHGHGKERGELVFVFHHTIFDGMSGTNFLHELLDTYAALASGEAIPFPEPLKTPPTADRLFPPAFRGWRLALKSAAFMAGKMHGELSYRLSMRRHRALQLSPVARVQILPHELDVEFTTRLARCSRRKQVTLNSLIQATLLQIAHRRIGNGRDMPLRTFVFFNLRPYLDPPVSDVPLASYIAMSWHDIPVSSNTCLWSLSREIQRRIYESAKRGHKYVAAATSSHFMKITLGVEAFRMGNTALTFTGNAGLDKRYGPLRIRSLHAFVSNNRLGPEFSIRGGIFDGRLSIDVFTLDTDMSREAMRQVVEEMKAIWEQKMAEVEQERHRPAAGA